MFNFEFNKPFFWALCDWTWEFILSEYINAKSKKIIWQSLLEKNNNEDNGLTQEQALEKARLDIAKREFPELFQLKTKFFNEYSPLLQHFCNNVANALALDNVYNAVGSFNWYGKTLYPLSAPPDKWSNFYLSCPNAQSVRNRYRMVSKLLFDSGEGRVLSIASGSAQPVIHAAYQLKKEGKKMELTLTDISEEALEIAGKRAKQADIKAEFQKVSFKKLGEFFKKEKFSVVEACGILDYLRDKQAIELIRFALEKGEKIVISNMNRTRGANILLKKYNWPIIYRTPAELASIIKEAGGKDVELYVEPWRIHVVAIAKKT